MSGGGAAELVRTAERLTPGGRISAFSEVLQYIANAVHADGCILWEVASFMPEDKRYFVLVDQFSTGKEHGAGHYLTERSITHQAISQKRPECVRDVDAAPSLEGSEFLRSKEIKSFFSVPIQLRKVNGEAAVNLYYRAKEGFGPSEIAIAEELAACVPHLFNSMVNSVVFGLQRKVDKLLRESGPANLSMRVHPHGQTLPLLAELVHQEFNAEEVSIYLENPLDAPGSYRRVAGRWPWRDSQPVLEYKRGGKGLTPYVIEHGAVRFLDLFNYNAELASRQSQGEYRGLKWNMTEAEARKAVKGLLGDRWIPPCSFLGVPVKNQIGVLGVIRCVLAQPGPHYFDDTHIDGLSLVAERLGEWWGHAIEVQRRRGETSQLRHVLQGVAKLNGRLYNELRKQPPDKQRIFDETLNILAANDASGEALAIRLVDPVERCLRPAAFHGARWHDKEGKDKQSHKISLESTDWTARAVREQHVLSERNAQATGKLANVFPDANSWIVAPIMRADKAIGTIGTQRFSKQEFPDYAELVYELMGKQLGLYISLVEQLGNFQEANRKLNEQSRQQIQIFEDFQHQIRNPIIKAHRLIQRFARAPQSHADLLRPILSACRRADHMSQSIRYFTALAQEMPLPVQKVVLRREELLVRISELVNDGLHGLDSRRRLTCNKDEESFFLMDTLTVSADHDLLLHCMDNLLDNAWKYSFPETQVLIKAGFQSRERLFHISVLNEGLKISSQEATQLVQRGYRGDQAQWSTAEGRGIGLWIVDHFMKAMNGSLRIIPTNSRGLNEFRLVLPAA